MPIRRAAVAVEQSEKVSAEVVFSERNGVGQLGIVFVGPGKVGSRLFFQVGIQDHGAIWVAAVIPAEVQNQVLDAIFLDPAEAAGHEFPEIIDPVIIIERFDGHDGRALVFPELQCQWRVPEIGENDFPDRGDVRRMDLSGLAGFSSGQSIRHGVFFRESEYARIEHREAILELRVDKIRIEGVRRSDGP